MFEFSGQYDFPEHSESFEDRMKEIEAGKLKKSTPKVGKDIGGVDVKEEEEEEDVQKIISTNKNDKEMQKLARLKQLVIPMDKVKADWWLESGPSHIERMAQHYAIFRDLFNGDFFRPSLELKVKYDYDDEFVTPVYYGNVVCPCDAQSEPHISYSSPPDHLYTLLLVNPDESLTNQHQEYLHWMITNIPGDNVGEGDVLVQYMPPVPAAGTGYHRNVLILLEQTERMHYDGVKRVGRPVLDRGLENLNERLFCTHTFHQQHSSHLTPKAMSFFQSEWDESVRSYYRNVLGMGEPVFSYDWPTQYHPPPKKYPHREPFNIYFDRYRDIKDIGEEVIRAKLQTISPFRQGPELKLQFPLAHKARHYKPSWLLLKEELMHRRVEQYKDLD